MQRQPHNPTWIAILRDEVENWRKENAWSRETVADQIVSAHERIGGRAVTGITFDPPTRDTFERMRVNADRVFRWLDDVTKDKNHLPANFIPTILAALPDDRRMHVLDDMVRPLGFAVRSAGGGDEVRLRALFRQMLKEGSESEVAVSDLFDGATQEELVTAQRELAEDILARSRTLAAVEDAIAKRQWEGA